MDQSEIRTSFKNAICSMYQAIVVFDKEDGSCSIVDLNPELSNLGDRSFGFDEFCWNLNRNVHPGDREEFEEFISSEGISSDLKRKVSTSMICRIRQADGHYHWNELSLCHATEEDSTRGTEYLLLIRDMDEEKRREIARTEVLKQAALSSLREKYNKLFVENMTDQQTGCYNRKGLSYYEKIVLNEARENGKDLFVCVVDLSGLKFLNDHYGHLAGDIAIAEVARQLHRTAPRGSCIVRTGGDEFLVFAALERGSTEPDRMGRDFDSGLDDYNGQHADRPYQVGASYGWVFLPATGDMNSLSDYIGQADKLMYAMKKERDLHQRK